MAHFDDARALVVHTKKALTKLEQDYHSSLNERTIRQDFLIDIKSLMENLRSALDFSAHGLFHKCSTLPKANPKIYFPYATLQQTQAAFQASQRIEICIPGITVARPDIVARLETYQHYSNPANRWLPLFMDLNNENKHERLTPQTRSEARQLRIQSREATLELGPGAVTDLGQDASIQIGDAVIRGPQAVSGDRPATVDGAETQTIIVWVSFRFDSNGEEVLPFLQNAVNQVDRIVNELAIL